MKKITKLIALCLALFCLTGCGQTVLELGFYDEIGNGYNPTLFYQNKIQDFGADPGVLYITDENDAENYGWFYLYPTCDYDAGTYGIVAYRSKDLVSWEAASMAFSPTDESYAVHSFWAPEVIFDAQADRAQYGLGEGKGVYYMFYSSNDKNNPEEIVFATHEDEKTYLAIQEEISKMNLNAVKKQLASYETSEKMEIKVILSDYEYNSQNSTADTLALAKAALAEIRTIDIPHWTVRNDYGLGLAVSASPEGPFVQYVRENPEEGQRKITIEMPFLCSEDMTEYADGINKVLKPDEVGFSMIDPHPYVDPNTGRKYLYFVRRCSRSGIEGNYICGIEMGDSWSDDPKWETLTRLTSCWYTTPFGNEKCDTDVNLVNEGPFVYYQDGTYFLTYSVGNYNDTSYSVCQAVSNAPLGEFRKLSKEEGGYILTADGRDDVSAPGHHSFVYCEDEIYIVYHAHWDRVTHTGQRGFAADRIYLTENGNGQLVMQCNGPTVVPMPLIGTDAQYRNIGTEADVSASGSVTDNAQCLNDGQIAVYSFVDFVEEYVAKGKSSITMEFADYRTVRALMLFNSKDTDYTFDSVKQIRFYYKDADGQEKIAAINNLKFNADEYINELGMITRCASAMAEFEELSVKKIEIFFEESDEFRISEIYVLGK